MSGIKSHKKAQSKVRRQSQPRRQTADSSRRRGAASADPRGYDAGTRRSASASARRTSASRTRRPSSAGSRTRTAARPQRVKRTIKPSAGYKLRKKLPFIIAAAALVLLFWAGLTVKHAISLRGYDKSKIAATVKIGPVDVSGMTRKQAMKAVKKYVKKSRGQVVTMAVEGDSAELSLKDLGLTAKHKDKLAAEALAYGSSGSVNHRYRNLKKLEKGPYVIPLKLELDHEHADEMIERQCEPYEDGPQNATMEVDGDDVKIVKGKSGMVVDGKKTVKAIEKKLNSDWNGGDISVTVTANKQKPAVTEDDLADLKDVLGTYQTSFEGSDEGRINNITVGVEMINGTVLQPGETFSADGAMRPYTAERGWQEAGSYENGDVVDTMGGGICQISSTLYNAVLYAELEVVERRQHSMRVSYVDPSRDAAIAGDMKDFKFKNDSDDPIYIYGHVEDETVTFSIYGKEKRPKDRKVEYTSEVVSTEDYKTVYKACSENIGYYMITANGHEGMTAKLWKTVTENGQEGEPEEVNTSEYRTQNTVVSVGVSGSPAASNIVTGALASQNDATIRAAIARARAY